MFERFHCRVLHHRKHDPSGGNGVRHCFMMLESVSNAAGQSIEPMVWHVRPHGSREAAGAKIAEGRAWKLKMPEGLLQNAHVKAGVVSDDYVGLYKVGDDLGCDGWKLGRVLDAEPVQPMDVPRPFGQKEAVPFWRLDQPALGFDELSIFKNSDTCRAGADAAVVSGFKIQADDFHDSTNYAVLGRECHAAKPMRGRRSSQASGSAKISASE